MTDIMLNRCRTLTRAMSLVSCLLLAPASQGRVRISTLYNETELFS